MIADSNFLLDTLVCDRKRHGRAIQIVQELRGHNRQAKVTAATLHEVVYVLSAARQKNGYGRQRQHVLSDIGAILEEPAFVFPEESLLRSAVGLYAESRLDFHDCYLAVLAKHGSTTLLSFDGKLAEHADVDPIVSGATH